MSKALADFIQDVAKEESLRFIEEDPELNSMAERQKKFMIRLMTDRVVDRFFAELSKKIDNAPKAVWKLKYVLSPAMIVKIKTSLCSFR